MLLLAFVLAGRGLGVSGAVAYAVGMRGAAGDDGGSAAGTGTWLLVEVAGLLVGGALSAAAAGRWRGAVERGAATGARARLLTALGGGVLMGVGARLARGCTSGQALTGGAQLSAGGWTFMLALFAGAYLVAFLGPRRLGRQFT